MALVSGMRLGTYEVVSLLGAGGMGEVYRAHDRKLGRDVALKVLPAAGSGAGGDRAARFEREAQVLAALNHTNIAHIYGLADGEGVSALVMELVEGPTLAELIASGGMNIDEALGVARQIAEGLEAAHEHGIVHRDLKPANVKVRPDGTVKILDFGLAKALSGDAASGSADAIDDSPTITSPMATRFGVILGTAAYMAPEQARGRVVDRRADIWAFGCVVYEMLTGRRPFPGDSVADVLSGVVSREPDWEALPALVPRSVAVLLRRCLEKDPRKRLRDIGEARLVLEAAGTSAEGDRGPLATGPSARRRGWTIPALVATIVAFVGVAGWLAVSNRARGAAVPGMLTRFDVQPPDPAATLSAVFRPTVALSANGKTVAFVAASGGVDRVYVRTRADTAAHIIPGSDRGSTPAVSPDGHWVAFFADGAVRKAPIDGEAVALASARDVRGISWSDDGMLFLTADAAAPLVSLPAAGGSERPVTTLAAGERTHRWPQALPGGKAVLFTVGTVTSPDRYDEGNIDAVVVATGERRVLIRGAAMARYCGDGRLLYSKGAGLFAVGFDPDRLTTVGEPVQVVQTVARDASTGAAHFACASDGTMAFVPATAATELRNLVWVDATGTSENVKLPAGLHQEVRVSPDGTRAALLGGTSGSGDVWIYEFARGTFSRLTFTGTNAAPTWSPDGRSVYFSSFDGSGATLLKKPADGSRDAVPVARIEGRAYITGIDPHETGAIIDAVSTTDRDIVRISFASEAAPERLIATSFNEYAGAVSGDGRWLAYQSDATGRAEVYVLDLGGSGARWQVTFEGGEEPHWSRDRRQLFYRSANRLMAVPIEPGTTFRHGQPRGLFDGVYTTGIESGRSYDVNPANGRFLLTKPAGDSQSLRTVRMVLNWPLDMRPR